MSRGLGGLVGHFVVLGLGVLLSVGFYASLHEYAEADSLLLRYTAGHWVEYVETTMFFWALAVLAAKAWEIRRQRCSLDVQLLPPWNGEAVPVSEAQSLLARFDGIAPSLQESLLVERVRAALDFVHGRGSTEGFDDHLRAASDSDANAADGSYALIRYLTWAIPILGFLGTVLGITEAIANITPEQLASSITGVTDGLAIAFDTTAIALGYSMVLMFATFVLDRREQALLADIDAAVERELAHRFERTGAEGNEVVELLRRNNQAIVQTTEQIVQKQAQLWIQTLEAMRTRFDQAGKEQQDRLTAALCKLLDQTLAAHQQRLAEQEREARKQTTEMLAHIERIGKSVRESAALTEKQSAKAAEQSALLGQLLDSEHQLLRLQETLQQNLQTLAHTGGFQQALHSLTAAIHLLTARAEAPVAYAPGSPRPATRQGNAA